MTVTIQCNWCGSLIEPGDRFIQDTVQRFVMISDGWEGVGDPTVQHFHEQQSPGNPHITTCYEHSRE